MAGVRFAGVSKSYPDGTEAVRDLTLDVADGELMVLVGPSGSGKTTALRMVAGLETVTEGAVEIGGKVVNDVPPRERDIAMVFQNYALYPHMTASDNMSFGLRLRGMERPAREQRVERTSSMLGIGTLLAKRPRFLSGGQRQRVAMGRAVVREPQVFLMDEPLSNLDAQLRVQMRAEIQELQRSLGVTTLYVTHDQVEAMTMGDRVAVFRDGRLQQVAEPAELYRRPANTFVAGFVGNPPMNFLPERMWREGHELHAELPEGALVGLRPEALTEERKAGAAGSIDGTVELVELLGADSLLHLSPDGAGEDRRTRVIARLDGEAPARLSHGDRCRLWFDVASVHLFDPDTGVRLPAPG
jgi:ABC-type sugar transport system ATPase subunit